MKTIFADFNNMSDSTQLRLNCIGSQKDLVAADLQPGDWAWFSDGELIVGGKIGRDARDGDVAALDWDTLVHLDEPWEWQSVLLETKELVSRPPSTEDEVWRLFQLFTVFERIAPPEALSFDRPGYYSYCRALVLLQLRKLDLALVEIQEAKGLSKGDPEDDFLYLEILRLLDFPTAVREARLFAVEPLVGAKLLAESIHVLGNHAARLDDDAFRAFVPVFIELADSFEHAPDASQVPPMYKALVEFNRGLIQLRLGHLDEARRSLDLAIATEPSLSEFADASRLTTDDAQTSAVITRFYDRTVGVPKAA